LLKLNFLLDLFDPSEHDDYEEAFKEVGKSRNPEVVRLFQLGLGIHHAGMLRPDRKLVEKWFERGVIKVCLY
jgi:replicative superfamily II helicase